MLQKNILQHLDAFFGDILSYYIGRSVLLKNKTLVESMNHYIRDPSDVFPYVTLASDISANDVTIPALFIKWT